MNEMIIKVNGMMCEGCENRVKNALSMIEGVESVQANHKDGIVKIISKDIISSELVKERINDMGFEIE